MLLSKLQGALYISHAASGKSSVTALTSGAEVADYLEKNQGINAHQEEKQADKKAIELSPGQKDAVALITTTQDRFVAIQGYAGTGKSTMLQEAQTLTMLNNAKEALGDNKNKVQFIGLAPTHQAVKELEAKAISSQTAKSLLFEESSKYLKAHEGVDMSDKVFLLDESSMISNKDFKDFMAMVEKTNARAVFIGDIKQLQSLEAGAPFTLLVKGEHINTVYMTNIQRQASDQYYLKAVYSLIEDKPYLADKLLSHQQGGKHIDYKDHTNQDKIKLNINEAALTDKENKTLNPSEKAEAKIQTMLKDAADEYLSRTPESREKTLIVANSHNERQVLSEYIRAGLKDEGVLDNHQKIIVKQLINLDKSAHEMTEINTYKKDYILQKGQNEYHHIIGIDKDNKILTLRDTQTNEVSHMVPSRTNHRFNGLFRVEEKELAVNDKVLIRKTDKAKDMVANQEFKVSDINSKSGIISLQNDRKSIQLDSKNINEMHWDYAYTKTTYSAQGATYPFVISIDKSNSPLANILSDYVKKSRGSHHVMVFTDNKKAYLSKIASSEYGNKIALEVTGEFAHKVANNDNNDNKVNPKNNNQISTAGFNKADISAENHTKPPQSSTNLEQVAKQNEVYKQSFGQKAYDPRYLDHNGKFDIRKYGADVASELKKYTESVAYQLLGEPNKSRSNQQVLAYGNDSASLKITLTGKYRGHYKDWADKDDHGDLLTLIMREMKLEYADAVMAATKMISMPDAFIIKENKQHEQLTKQTDNKAKTSEYGIKLWGKAKDINGTIAQNYLNKHRNIYNLKGSDIKFNPNVFSRESSQKYQPALLAAFKNSKEEVTAVEAIYLDRKTHNKADFKVGKRTYGAKAGSSVLINPGAKDNNITLMAEGVVTAMSLKEVFKDYHIIAAGGKENFKNINPEALKDNVVICADNDGKPLDKDSTILSVVNELKSAGKLVTASMPPSINDSKTDYNDILKTQGKSGVESSLKGIDKAFDYLNKATTGIDTPG